ncbi:hypothetical protein E2C01_058703 [Portunus trituberculatus]|uniref:Uncharacterized protein n=1 Tax=Portunus trituberculatus TaxID=210409 RepID=A0A5B7H4W2_PORTR|nr:hypothetical protein [Portunus trituberculatus]
MQVQREDKEVKGEGMLWWLGIDRHLTENYREATECLTSDLTKKNHDWGEANLVMCKTSKTQYLNLSIRHNFLGSCPLFFNDTQLFPSFTLNIPGLSLTYNQ